MKKLEFTVFYGPTELPPGEYAIRLERAIVEENNEVRLVIEILGPLSSSARSKKT